MKRRQRGELRKKQNLNDEFYSLVSLLPALPCSSRSIVRVDIAFGLCDRFFEAKVESERVERSVIEKSTIV